MKQPCNETAWYTYHMGSNNISDIAFVTINETAIHVRGSSLTMKNVTIFRPSGPRDHPAHPGDYPNWSLMLHTTVPQRASLPVLRLRGNHDLLTLLVQFSHSRIATMVLETTIC